MPLSTILPVPDPAKTKLVKRSVSIAGHRTSVALESAFWPILDAAARRRGLAATALITAIDAVRGKAPLAASLRVFLLAEAALIRTQTNGDPASTHFGE